MQICLRISSYAPVVTKSSNRLRTALEQREKFTTLPFKDVKSEHQAAYMSEFLLSCFCGRMTWTDAESFVLGMGWLKMQIARTTLPALATCQNRESKLIRLHHPCPTYVMSSKTCRKQTKSATETNNGTPIHTDMLHSVENVKSAITKFHEPVPTISRYRG
jgi:hypothetical protein